MKNYDVCKDINEFYFNNYASLELSMPAFFDEFTEEGIAIQEISKQIASGNYDHAVALAEHNLQHFTMDASTAFLSWQVYAYWKQGKLPNSELIAYFASLEEVFPKEAFVHFNKAALYVRDKNFNEAVKELVKARRKESEHPATLVLLFWIYYFSRDDQWHSLFNTIEKGKMVPQIIIDLVNTVEAINDKKQTSLYLSADSGDLKQSNKALFEKFPEFVLVKQPTQENVLMVAAESNYFNQYVIAFLLSGLEIKSRNFGIHVHLYSPMGVDLELLQHYDEKYPELNLSYSYEKSSHVLNSEAPSYYASMRFCRAYQLLETSDAVKKIAVTDADVLIRKDLFERDDIKSSDIALISSPDITPIWEKFAGGFVSFSKNETSLNAFAYLANILLKNFAAKKEFWFIDQIAIFDMYQSFSKTSKITRIPLGNLFGQNMKHTPDATLWTYTNEDKHRDNPMNREKQRLLAQYSLPQEWNGMVRAKYGIVIANKNDEYIGRALLNFGSWCDHEIKFLKTLISFGDTVLEIGSNMGSHTLPLAKQVGNKGKLIAMEPQRLLFQTMCANVAMNSMQNVYAMNVACGEQKGVLRVTELDPTAHQNFGGYRPKEMVGDMEIPVITMDSLNLTRCDVIKMDIEGMEIDALKGGQETLRKFEPILFFESHGDLLLEIEEFLKDFGYTVYDFAIPNDPMFLAVTDKNKKYADILNIKPLAAHN